MLAGSQNGSRISRRIRFHPIQSAINSFRECGPTMKELKDTEWNACEPGSLVAAKKANERTKLTQSLARVSLVSSLVVGCILFAVVSLGIGSLPYKGGLSCEQTREWAQAYQSGSGLIRINALKLSDILPIAHCAERISHHSKTKPLASIEIISSRPFARTCKLFLVLCDRTQTCTV